MPSPRNSPGTSGQAQNSNGRNVPARITKQQQLINQLHFFLEASEEIDLSEEVAEELLLRLPRDPSDNEDGAIEREISEDDWVEIEETPEGEITFSSLFRPRTPASNGDNWTKQDIRFILHHLKEKGPRSFIAEYVVKRNIPIPKLLLAFGLQPCPELLSDLSSDSLMYMLEVAMSMQLSKRERLPQYSTPEDALNLIQSSKKILVLTGAGISVSCGIPDFRSRDGLYAQLKERGEYDLDDPQQMFDVHYFRENPSVSGLVAYCPGLESYVPLILKFLCELLRNYTQNIDTLESKAGIQKVMQCHGSFATASCVQCRRRVPGSEIEDDIMNQRVPLCTVCNATPIPAIPVKKPKKKKGKKEWEHSDSDDDNHSTPPQFPPGIMKPDITFFGEKLDDSFEKALNEDRGQVDLLLVIGTSLKVAPVADILTHIPHSVPQILINKTPIRHINPDIVLLGDADAIIYYLEHASDQSSSNVSASPDNAEHLKKMQYERVADSHISLFQGAEGGRWLDEFRDTLEWKKQAEAEASAKAAAAPPQNSGRRASGKGSDRDIFTGSDDSEGRTRKRQRVSH